MDRREFQEKVEEHAGKEMVRVSGRPVRSERQYFEAEWVTGGLTGGNCWGDEADTSLTADPEPELRGLDEVLAEVCPSITFIQYKLLMKEMEYDEYEQGEYYGNYVIYGTKKLSVDTVYDKLVEWGYL